MTQRNADKSDGRQTERARAGTAVGCGRPDFIGSLLVGEAPMVSAPVPRGKPGKPDIHSGEWVPEKPRGEARHPLSRGEAREARHPLCRGVGKPDIHSVEEGKPDIHSVEEWGSQEARHPLCRVGSGEATRGSQTSGSQTSTLSSGFRRSHAKVARTGSRAANAGCLAADATHSRYYTTRGKQPGALWCLAGARTHRLLGTVRDGRRCFVAPAKRNDACRP